MLLRRRILSKPQPSFPQLSTMRLKLHADDATSYPGSGTTWYDMAGWFNTTIQGTPIFNSNTPKSLEFTPYVYGLVAAAGSGSEFDKQDFSIKIKFKILYGYGYSILWSHDYYSHNDPYYAQHIRWDGANRREPNSIVFGFNIDGTYHSVRTGNNTVFADTWYTLVVQRNGGVISIYLDDYLLAQETWYGTITYYSTPVRIAAANFSTDTDVLINLAEFYTYNLY